LDLLDRLEEKDNVFPVLAHTEKLSPSLRANANLRSGWVRTNLNRDGFSRGSETSTRYGTELSAFRS
jgi:hypothetical protein